VGDVTRTETAKAYNTGGASAYVATTARYDAYGRVTHVEDPLAQATDTTYTGTPLTQTVVTDPAGFTTTTTLDPALGLATSTQDVNGRVTEMAYDPLGRLTGVWLPDRPRASNSTGSVQFAYHLSNTDASWVRTDKLAPSSLYLSSYTIFD